MHDINEDFEDKDIEDEEAEVNVMLKDNYFVIPKKDFKQYLFDNYSTDETIQMYENSALSQPVMPVPFPDPEEDQDDPKDPEDPEDEKENENK